MPPLRIFLTGDWHHWQVSKSGVLRINIIRIDLSDLCHIISNADLFLYFFPCKYEGKALTSLQKKAALI